MKPSQPSSPANTISDPSHAIDHASMNHAGMDHASMDHAASDDGLGKKTLSTYLLGFILAIVLTCMPFYAVIYRIASPAVLLAIIWTCALWQLWVHAVFFLRLHVRSEQGILNVVSFAFTMLIALVVLLGSLWVMSNLNYYMMH